MADSIFSKDFKSKKNTNEKISNLSNDTKKGNELEKKEIDILKEINNKLSPKKKSKPKLKSSNEVKWIGGDKISKNIEGYIKQQKINKIKDDIEKKKPEKKQSIIVTLKQKNEKIKGVYDDIMKNIKSVVIGLMLVIGGVASLFKGLFSDGPFKGSYRMIGTMMIDLGKKIGGKFLGLIGGLVKKLFAIPFKIIGIVFKKLLNFGPVKKVIGKIGGGLFKTIGKKALPFLAKFLKFLKGAPLIGALIGIGFAISRFMKGDILGGILELLSGIASMFPGIGTAISYGIMILLAVRDVRKSKKKKVKTKGPNILTKMSNAIKGFVKSLLNWFKNHLGSFKYLLLGPIGIPMMIMSLLGFDPKEKILKIKEKIKNKGPGIFNKIKKGIKKILIRIKEWFKSHLGSFKYLLLGPIGIPMTIMSLLGFDPKEKLIDGSPDEEVKEKDNSSFIDDTIGWIKDIVFKFKDIINQVFQKITDFIMPIIDKFKELVIEFKKDDALKKVFDNLEKIIDNVSEAINGFVNAFKEKMQYIKDRMKALLEKLKFWDSDEKKDDDKKEIKKNIKPIEPKNPPSDTGESKSDQESKEIAKQHLEELKKLNDKNLENHVTINTPDGKTTKIKSTNDERQEKSLQINRE